MLNESVSIYITNIDKENIDLVQNNYEKEFQIENNVIRMEIPKPLNSNSLLIELHDFFEKFKSKKRYELSPSCIFDVNNLTIVTPDKTEYLTSKEGLFLNHLIKNNEIISYDYMTDVLWNDASDISKNALRQFVKNINRKLPPKILKNIRGIGYKLNIDYRVF